MNQERILIDNITTYSCKYEDCEEHWNAYTMGSSFLNPSDKCCSCKHLKSDTIELERTLPVSHYEPR